MRKTNHFLKALFQIFILLILVVFTSCSTETAEEQDLPSMDFKIEKAETWQDQIDYLTKAMRPYHNFQVAQAHGYTVLLGPPGNEYVPQMGYHYLNPSLADGEFELLKPEILVYYPDENGDLQFGAAEYLDPIAGFTPPEGCVMDPNSTSPEGFIGDADEWHPVCGAGGWTLHAWVGLYNEDGVFNSTNSVLP